VTQFGALAEFERSLIRERTQAGLAAARRAGPTGGRPPKPTDADIEAAEAMLANPDIGVTQIAHPISIYARRARTLQTFENDRFIPKMERSRKVSAWRRVAAVRRIGPFARVPGDREVRPIVIAGVEV
jgi:hypothetical protein